MTEDKTQTWLQMHMSIISNKNGYIPSWISFSWGNNFSTTLLKKDKKN